MLVYCVDLTSETNWSNFDEGSKMYWPWRAWLTHVALLKRVCNSRQKGLFYFGLMVPLFKWLYNFEVVDELEIIIVKKTKILLKFTFVKAHRISIFKINYEIYSKNLNYCDESKLKLLPLSCNQFSFSLTWTFFIVLAIQIHSKSL